MTKVQSASESGITESQVNENRIFDKNIAVHQEKISSLEKSSEDIENRVRNLEKFKYMTIGIVFLVGILLSAFIQWIIKTFS